MGYLAAIYERMDKIWQKKVLLYPPYSKPLAWGMTTSPHAHSLRVRGYGHTIWGEGLMNELFYPPMGPFPP